MLMLMLMLWRMRGSHFDENLGRVDKVWQPFADRGETKEAGEGECGFVVSRGDTAELLGLAIHALDAIAITIAPEVAGNGLATVGLGRDALHQEIFPDAVTVNPLSASSSLGLACRSVLDTKPDMSSPLPRPWPEAVR